MKFLIPAAALVAASIAAFAGHGTRISEVGADELANVRGGVCTWISEVRCKGDDTCSGGMIWVRNLYSRESGEIRNLHYCTKPYVPDQRPPRCTEGYKKTDVCVGG